MKRVQFLPEAEVEISPAVDWYEARRKGLGGQFLYSLEATIEIVQRNPDIYPNIFGEARRAVLRRYPYSLIYIATADEFLIAACVHARRDPNLWQRRL